MEAADLKAFVTVVQEGSFSAAAKRLGVAKSTVSGRMVDLEASLGVRLMHRTTRRFQLTTRGEELFKRGQDIVAAIEEAERAVSVGAEDIAGSVRMSAPTSLGSRYLGAVLHRLSLNHPGLELEVDLSDASVDLVEQHYDLALRVGEINQMGATVRLVGNSRRLVVGSPSYFKLKGRPKQLEDLKHHACLRFSLQRSPNQWTFQTGSTVQNIRVTGPTVSNNGDLLASAAEHGLGLAWLPEFVVESQLATGRLKCVLDKHCEANLPIHLVFPTRHFMPARVRIVADAVRGALGSVIA